MKIKLQTLLRHKLQWLLLLVTLLGVSQSVLAGKYRIYFYRPSGWTEAPHIHVWKPNGSDIANNQTMTSVGGNVYYYDLTTTQTGLSLIFNNHGWNGQSKTKTGWNPANNTYFTCNGNDTDITSYTPRTFSTDEYIYLKNIKPSGWGQYWVCSDVQYAYLYMWGGSAGVHTYRFNLVEGTAYANGAVYGAKIQTSGTYRYFVITRGTSSCSDGDFPSVYNNDKTSDVTFDAAKNYITDYTKDVTSVTWSYYAIKPSSCAISLGGSHSGSGTSADPYIVEPGESLTFTISATHADPGMTGVRASVNTTESKESNASGSSVTVSKTASASRSADETWVGYAWAYKSSTSYTSSSYVTSGNTIYTQTANDCSYPSAPTTITASASPICAGASSTITTSTATGGYTYKLYDGSAYVGDPIELATDGTLDFGSVTPAVTTTYTMYAIETGSGCEYTRVGSASATVTVNAVPTITLTGVGGKSASATYPWDYMTITATTTPADLVVNWTKLYSGSGSEPVNSVTKSASPSHTYKIKSAITSNPNSDKYTIKANGTSSGCAAIEAVYDVYINNPDGEICD